MDKEYVLEKIALNVSKDHLIKAIARRIRNAQLDTPHNMEVASAKAIDKTKLQLERILEESSKSQPNETVSNLTNVLANFFRPLNKTGKNYGLTRQGQEAVINNFLA